MQYMIFEDRGEYHVDENENATLEMHLREVWMYDATPDFTSEHDDLAKALDAARETAARNGRRVLVMDREKWTNGEWKPALVYTAEPPPVEKPWTVRFTKRAVMEVEVTVTATDAADAEREGLSAVLAGHYYENWEEVSSDDDSIQAIRVEPSNG